MSKRLKTMNHKLASKIKAKENSKQFLQVTVTPQISLKFKTVMPIQTKISILKPKSKPQGRLSTPKPPRSSKKGRK